METPQEVEVWLILPALRKQLALSLKEVGMKQKDIAKSLNITGAAVSFYLNKKRGEEIIFSGEINEKIKDSAKRIFDNKSPVRLELQQLLKTAKENKFICSVCQTHAHSEKSCNICFV